MGRQEGGEGRRWRQRRGRRGCDGGGGEEGGWAVVVIGGDVARVDGAAWQKGLRWRWW